MRNLVLCIAALLCGAYGQIPTVTISPARIAGEVGETVAFYCDSQIFDGGFNIILEMYDPVQDVFVSFDDSTGRLRRYDNGAFANFTFGPLGLDDNGIIIRCFGIIGQMPSGNATIVVQFIPIVTAITSLDRPLTRRENVSVVIQLNVSGNPQPTFSWRQVGSQMPLSNGSGVIVAFDTLTFNNIGRERTGQYVYEAANPVGRSNISFELDVLYPPEFPAEVYSPNTLNCTQQGQHTTCASYPGVDITFQCNASGNPMPDIILLMPPGPNVQTVDNDILVTSVRRENAGNYSCTASSSEFPDNNVTRYFELFVGGVAFPLSKLTVMVTNTSVVVMWTYNDGALNAVPATYAIANVTLNGILITTPLPPIDINRMSVVIPSAALEGEQTYMVSVVVRNLQGDSQPVTAEFTTPRIFSGATVPELTCSVSESETNGDIIVTWSIVHTGGLPLTALSTNYTFRKGSTSFEGGVMVDNLDSTTASVPGLVVGITYDFTVTARNDNGSATASCGTIFHRIGIPARPDFVATQSGPGAGEVTLRILTSSSGVTLSDQRFAFIITPVLGGDSNRQDSLTFERPDYRSGDVETIRVSGLERGSVYTFNVSAVNIFGESEAANSPPVTAGGQAIISPSPSPPPPPVSGNNNLAAAVGGALGSILLVVIVIATVIIVVVASLRFRAYRKKELEYNVVYEEPGLHLDTHPPRQDPTLKPKQCPAHETATFKGEVDVNIELEGCPAYVTVK